MKVCEGQLYSMYNCHLRAFTTNEFIVFKGIIKGTHEYIHIDWMLNDPENSTVFDSNSNVEHLAFVVNGSNMYAKWRNEEPITREAFATIVQIWKLILKYPCPTSLSPFFCFHVQFRCMLILTTWFYCWEMGCCRACTRAPTMFSRARSFGCTWHHLPTMLVASECWNHLCKTPQHS